MAQQHPTELAKTLDSGDDMQEDSIAKNLFQINEVIAWIIKTIFPSCRTMAPCDIVSQCLTKADIRIGTEPLDQNIRPRITNMDAEDKSTTDGFIHYDLRTELIIPTPRDSGFPVIFNVEIQKKYTNDYNMDKRMIYYQSRLVSSQPGRLMQGRVSYKRLMPVVSCWIFPNAPLWMANTVRRIREQEELVMAMPQTCQKRKHKRREQISHDFVQIWKICLNDKVPPPRGYNVFWFLYVLFTRRMSCEEKLKILAEDFGLKSTMEVKKMCGFTEFVMNEGKRKWKAEGKKEGKEEGRREGKEIGRKEGKEIGRKEGKLEAWLETYANMKTQFDDVLIRSFLGITASQFNQVKNLYKERFIQQGTV